MASSRSRSCCPITKVIPQHGPETPGGSSRPRGDRGRPPPSTPRLLLRPGRLGRRGGSGEVGNESPDRAQPHLPGIRGGTTRLSRNGIITRIPHRNLYALTPDGLRFAIFYNKVHDRVLRPLMAGDQPQAPPPLRDALRVIDHEVTRRLAAARLPAAT